MDANELDPIDLMQLTLTAIVLQRAHTLRDQWRRRPRPAGTAEPALDEFVIEAGNEIAQWRTGVIETLQVM